MHGTRKRAASEGQRLWLPLGLPLASFVLVGLFGRRLPRHYQAAGLCVALVCAGFLIACGGGGSSATPISVSVSPNPVNTLWPNLAGAPAQTVNLTATVQGSTNNAVTWAITANGSDDTVQSTGANTATYTAPSAVPAGAVTVTATSQADTTKKGTTTVNIKVPTPAGTTGVSVNLREGTVQHSTGFNLTVN
jgi:hypothetical protein